MGTVVGGVPTFPCGPCVVCPPTTTTFSVTFSGITPCACDSDIGLTAVLNFTSTSPLTWGGLTWFITIEDGASTTIYEGEGCTDPAEPVDVDVDVILACEVVLGVIVYSLAIQFTTVLGETLAFYSESTDLASFTNFLVACDDNVFFTGGTAVVTQL